MSHKFGPGINVGPNTRTFLSSVGFLSESEQERVAEESKRSLGFGCVPDRSQNSKSVLVVGEVQSGKTLSFSTSIVLAQENAYRLFVVVAGTKRNLRDQTLSRLQRDLNYEDNKVNWQVFSNPSAALGDELTDILQPRSIPEVPVPVLVVMKTKASLAKLEALLLLLQDRVGVFPSLVIDDEADQAGLNVASNKPTKESAVYSQLKLCRSALPNHTYLMYTATSQALTLVDIEDHMSPDHVFLLDTSDSYVGPLELLDEDSNPFFRRIPESEIIRAVNPILDRPPLPSFRSAIAYFFLATSVGLFRKNPSPSSMLIHPDLLTAVHDVYKDLTKRLLREFLVGLSTANPLKERTDFFDAEFVNELKNLESSVDLKELGLVSYEDKRSFFLERIPDLLARTQVRIINSSRNSLDVQTNEWKNHPAWILIGGAKMERGYTIENLIVTYMPRGIGMGIADNIQQRARFFGNKRSYADLLRGWLSQETFDFYLNIAEMEALLKTHLQSVVQRGGRLQDWVRELILSPGMKPTRDAAIGLQDLWVTSFTGGFRFFQTHLFSKIVNDRHTFQHNMDLIKDAFSASVFLEIDTREDQKRNTIVKITLADLINLLGDWIMARRDRQNLNAMLLGISSYLDRFPNAHAALIFVDQLQPRRRGIGKDSEETNPDLISIARLPQGRNAAFAGDLEMVVPELVTVQVHNIAPDAGDGSQFENALALAISLPIDMEKIVFHQNRPD